MLGILGTYSIHFILNSEDTYGCNVDPKRIGLLIMSIVPGDNARFSKNNWTVVYSHNDRLSIVCEANLGNDRIGHASQF